MSRRASKYIRKLVAMRAGFKCEYCQVLEYLSNYEYHIEHIIGLQHGGSNAPDNLAYACAWCNWKKGPNIATTIPPNHVLIPLFNPRTQNWFDHFAIESSGKLIGKSLVAEATIKLLQLNIQSKIEERTEMIKSGFYP
jgi:5-methylcytosine-specific restriction endonuclease McrA